MSDKPIDLDAIEKRAVTPGYGLRQATDVGLLLNAVHDRDAEIAIYVEHYEAHAAWKATFTAEWQQARPAALDANRAAFERRERAEAALDAHKAKASQ